MYHKQLAHYIKAQEFKLKLWSQFFNTQFIDQMCSSLRDDKKPLSTKEIVNNHSTCNTLDVNQECSIDVTSNPEK